MMKKMDASSPHPEYLSDFEVERSLEASRLRHDLFDCLLHGDNQCADAESSAKIEQLVEERMEEQPRQGHHGCRCSKIGCLKLYCQCFASGRKCGGGCECSCCRNKPGNEQEIHYARMLANYRHPGHFKGVPALTPNKKCTCKKSQCQKRYCECYSAGLKCSQFCECKDCQNGHPHAHDQPSDYSNFNDHMMEIEVPA